MPTIEGTLSLDADVEMKEESKDNRGNIIPVFETEKLRKFGAAFNFNQQELLHGYQTSMNIYSDDRISKFLLQDPLN